MKLLTGNSVINLLRRKKVVFYVCFFILSLVPLLFRFKREPKVVNLKTEQYDPKLLDVNTLNKASAYIDEEFSKLGISYFDTAKYVQLTSKFTKDRFFHGLARYSYSDNWIAYSGSIILWDHLSAIVDPNDILNNSEGLCSQQTIVFMELLKKKGIKTRSVGLGFKEGPGHFLTEVFYEQSWHLYDVTMEPQWKRIKNDHKPMEYYVNNKDSLFITYEGRLPRKTFDKIMSKIQYGDINEFPAKNMLVFHKVTYVLTFLIPCLLLLVLLKSSFSKKQETQYQKQTNSKKEASIKL